MRPAWAVARHDLAVWRRTPWAVAAALVPPMGMALLVAVLTWSVAKQPVALVVQGAGRKRASWRGSSRPTARRTTSR